MLGLWGPLWLMKASLYPTHPCQWVLEGGRFRSETPKQREMELWGCPRALGKRVQGEHDGEKVLKRSLEPQEWEHSPFSPHLCVGFGSLPRRPWWRCRWPPSEVQRGPGGGAWRLVGTSQRGS